MQRIGFSFCLLAALAAASLASAQDPASEVLDGPAAETAAPVDEAPVAEPIDESSSSETDEAAEEPATLDPEAPAPLDETSPAEDVEGEEEPIPGEDDADEAAVEETGDDEQVAASDWAGLVARAPAFLAKTHHAAVHLPIALWLFGAFFVLVGVVIPSWRTQIPLACLIGGAITAVAAVASGWWYAEYEYGEPWAWGDGFGDWSEQLVQHRWYGFGMALFSIFLSVLALVSQARQSRRLGFVWRLGLIALALAVAWEGHIGGELIHGEGFLEEAFQEWINPSAE